MNQIITEHNEEFKKVIEHFKEELSSLRTGRASPAMVENILVDAYGAKTPLKQLASVSVPEARTIAIQPWDKNLIKQIEKTLAAPELNFSAAAVENIVRISLPPLTEESRQKLVKMIGEKAEQARISLRGLRDKVKEEIIDQQRGKEITEDDKYSYLKELDEFTADQNDEVKKISETKAEEIMTI